MDTPFFHIFLSLRGYLLSKSSYLKKKLLFLWIVICDPTYLYCRGGLMSTCFFFTTVFDWLSTVTMSLLSFHVFKLLVKPKPTTPITQIFSRLASVSVSLVRCIIWAHFWCAQCFYRTTIIWKPAHFQVVLSLLHYLTISPFLISIQLARCYVLVFTVRNSGSNPFILLIFQTAS